MPFNPRSLKNLRKIIDKTSKKEDTQIILTSSWRISHDCMIVLKARLIEYGIKINAVTEKLDNRGEEIKEWLQERRLLPNMYGVPDIIFIIIDDKNDHFNEYFSNEHVVLTNPNRGLNYFKTKEAIHKLKGMKNKSYVKRNRLLWFKRK